MLVKVNFSVEIFFIPACYDFEDDGFEVAVCYISKEVKQVLICKGKFYWEEK